MNLRYPFDDFHDSGVAAATFGGIIGMATIRTEQLHHLPGHVRRSFGSDILRYQDLAYYDRVQCFVVFRRAEAHQLRTARLGQHYGKRVLNNTMRK